MSFSQDLQSCISHKSMARAGSPVPAPEPSGTDRVRELLKAFAELDIDHSGTITADELLVAAKKRGKSLSLDEAKLTIATKDLDSDGSLSLSEWLHFYQTGTIQEHASDDHVIEFMYSWFDTDGNHSIDRDELRGALLALSVPPSDDVLDRILHEVATHRPHLKSAGAGAAVAEAAASGPEDKAGETVGLLSLADFKVAVRGALKSAPDVIKAREEAIEKESYQFCTLC